MKPIHQRIHDYWFETAPATRLAILRLLVGGFVLLFLLKEYDGYLDVARTDVRLFAPVGVVFHGPVSAELFQWLLRGTLLGAICFTLGLGHRITGPIFAGLLLWQFCYRQSWSMIYHSDNLVALHVIVLGLTRSADALSLDALYRHWRRPGATAAARTGWQYGWPVKLMCALTVSAYFVTAVAKLSGPLGVSWMTGHNLRAQMAVDQIRKELLGGSPNAVSYTLYDWVALFSVLSVGSLALELLAPLALLHRRIGQFWAINTFLMHWGILLVMGIRFHYQLAGVMFASFFAVERLLVVPGKLWGRRKAAAGAPPEGVPGLAASPGLRHATLYYDGDCGLCDRFVQFVLRHDRREYFQFATLQSEAGRERLSRLGLPVTDLRTVVLVEAGESWVRSTATLRVCRRLAGPWPLLYVFMLVPQRLRDGVYSMVARNRKLWFRPPADCPVMPPEWRRRFVS